MFTAAVSGPANQIRPSLETIIQEPYYQDNSLALKDLLKMEGLNSIIYPPGCGKTSLAKLFEHYASDSEIIVFNNKIQKWLTESKFALKNPKVFESNRKKHRIIYGSFQDVEPSSLEELRQMLICWVKDLYERYVPETLKMKLICKEDSCPACLFHSLVHLIKNRNSTTYIILDACDTMFNCTTKFVGDSSKKAIKFLVRLIDCTGIENITVICFGVSPYFTREFVNMAATFQIANPKNQFHRYFCYEKNVILRTIQTWNLDISAEECLDLANFKFLTNTFINPSLCVKILQACKTGEYFKVEIRPRSLWMESVFHSADVEILLESLRKSVPIEVDFIFSIRDMANFQQKNTHHLRPFYPLFIYGGFFSCIKIEPNEKKRTVCELVVANPIMKSILIKNLRYLLEDELHVPITPICCYFIEGRFQKFCDVIYDALSHIESIVFKNESSYNNFLLGIFCCCLSMQGYEVRSNDNVGGEKPDLVISNKSLNYFTLVELKHINPKTLRKRKITISAESIAKRERLQDPDFYEQKEKLLNLVKIYTKQAKTQMHGYLSHYATTEKKVIHAITIVFSANICFLEHAEYLKDSAEKDLRWRSFIMTNVI